MQSKIIFFRAFYYFYTRINYWYFQHPQIRIIMTVRFQIIYKTHIGQVLMLLGSVPELGDGNRENACKMSLIDAESGLWEYWFDPTNT